MNSFLLVFLGGGLGSVLRYGISVMLKSTATLFPVATLAANGASSFVLGLIMGFLSAREGHTTPVTLFLAAGFCGGFSTFSTFSAETFEFLKHGQLSYALLNIAANLLICLVAIGAGMFLSKNF
ncbi:MAG TPA: fluoride efflux transporter CrcB [Bacteroidia bacterium]|nr:fluoride efflux transporter CrcB [Bacteroidia bacterium]